MLLIVVTLRPVLDGLSATKRIREMEGNGTLRGRVPIIAVSGNARSEWTERATCVGMDGFIRKPYSKKELNEVIARFFSANWHAHGQ
jgi:CheY-like chemotaxis protein